MNRAVRVLGPRLGHPWPHRGPKFDELAGRDQTPRGTTYASPDRSRTLVWTPTVRRRSDIGSRPPSAQTRPHPPRWSPRTGAAEVGGNRRPARRRPPNRPLASGDLRWWRPSWSTAGLRPDCDRENAALDFAQSDGRSGRDRGRCRLLTRTLPDHRRQHFVGVPPRVAIVPVSAAATSRPLGAPTPVPRQYVAGTEWFPMLLVHRRQSTGCGRTRGQAEDPHPWQPRQARRRVPRRPRNGPRRLPWAARTVAGSLPFCLGRTATGGSRC
jgi:hypothetical protein